ncbi:hypothetical protein CYY_000078 [Polysphondylium violaceum]|uniref:Leucine-rich repeat-containing protein n=1 Tax=Polysphondylium violaceum TaxID=133409 RepID=A0A8J4Q270_9MYCE|nr:hypothetical protein CYY_000078 [Polysphondylium violaceum]
MRLTAEVILRAHDSINPCKDRELNLRGYKISSIENLGVTKDQFDTIDFSDNEISKLENFPLLNRVKTLFFNNNHISRFDEDFGLTLPNLTTLVLSNNKLIQLSDLEPLTKLKNIKYLSLLDNPVTKKQNYRLYLIYLVPRLKILDFKKIKQIERDESKKIFGYPRTLDTKQQQKTTTEEKRNTFEPGEGVNGNGNKSGATKRPLTDDEKKAIRQAIDNAKTIEEITALENKLRSGETIVDNDVKIES